MNGVHSLVVSTYGFDFRTGAVPQTDGDRFQWLDGPTGDHCASNGVLKIAAPDCVTSVTIHIEVEKWRQFNIHLAGTRLNDGYGPFIFGSKITNNAIVLCPTYFMYVDYAFMDVIA